MHHSLSMRAVQRLGDLSAVAQNLVDRQRTAAQTIGQRLAIEQLHDQIVLADVIERADVRMIELRDRLRFALESQLEVRAVGQLRRQNLDCHLTIEPCVASAVHVAHPARADRREDLVRPEPSPSSDRDR